MSAHVAVLKVADLVRAETAGSSYLLSHRFLRKTGTHFSARCSNRSSAPNPSSQRKLGSRAMARFSWDPSFRWGDGLGPENMGHQRSAINWRRGTTKIV